MIRSDGLSVRIGWGISIPFLLAFNGQIAELPVDFGAGKGVLAISELHPLNLPCGTAALELHVNATGSKGVF